MRVIIVVQRIVLLYKDRLSHGITGFESLASYTIQLLSQQSECGGSNVLYSYNNIYKVGRHHMYDSQSLKCLYARMGTISGPHRVHYTSKNCKRPAEIWMQLLPHSESTCVHWLLYPLVLITTSYYMSLPFTPDTHTHTHTHTHMHTHTHTCTHTHTHNTHTHTHIHTHTHTSMCRYINVPFLPLSFVLHFARTLQSHTLITVHC